MERVEDRGPGRDSHCGPLRTPGLSSQEDIGPRSPKGGLLFSKYGLFPFTCSRPPAQVSRSLPDHS